MGKTSILQKIDYFLRIIEFDNAKSATRAKKLLNGTKLNGREIFADYVILLRVLIILIRETMTKTMIEMIEIIEGGEIRIEVDRDQLLGEEEVIYIKFGFIFITEDNRNNRNDRSDRNNRNQHTGEGT